MFYRGLLDIETEGSEVTLRWISEDMTDPSCEPRTVTVNFSGDIDGTITAIDGEMNDHEGKFYINGDTELATDHTHDFTAEPIKADVADDDELWFTEFTYSVAGAEKTYKSEIGHFAVCSTCGFMLEVAHHPCIAYSQ